MFIIDAHLDLSMNALEWNRDLRLSLEALRAREKDQTDLPGRSGATVTFEAMRRGNIGLCVATQIARYVKPSNPLPGWKSPEQAWAHTQGQLAWYKAMEATGELTAVTDLTSLHTQIDRWKTDSESKSIGYILSLEGADSIYDLRLVEQAYVDGLRAIGPAHYGPGTYAFGTDSVGGIGHRGKALLTEMERFNIILDATHLCDQSFWEALDHFKGSVWASHSLCRSIVNHNRQFSDEQIRALVDRGAVIGMALDAWMMIPDWKRGDTTPQSSGLTLDHLVDHIDHICQLVGHCRHIGIGTDLDGGFGKEQCPADLEDISDLQKLPQLLMKRGFSQQDIELIMHGNWIRFLEDAWKEG